MAFLAGLLTQLVMLPLLAAAVVYAAHGSPTLMLGLVIVAACPGNVSSPLLTKLAHGDVALSLTLVGASSLLSAASIPLTVHTATHLIIGSTAVASMPLGRTALSLFLLTTLPAAAGVGFRSVQTGIAEHLERKFPIWGTLILLLLVGIVLYGEWDQVKDSVLRTGVVVAAFNVLAIALGWCIARLVGAAAAQRSPVAIACGLRNCGVAALISLTLLRNAELVVPAFAYALFMWISAGMLILIARAKPVRALWACGPSVGH
jgi:bile acid:Na+ symporter, BASS family